MTQARAGVAAARSAQNAARLTSPLDGVATSVAARVGETAQPGIPLVTVATLADLRVEALVPDRRLPLLHIGQPARIAVDTRPGQSFPVTVREIARVAEPDGRTFRVKFHFTQPVAMRPGQTARITVLLR